jgi:hypothetical protein
MPAMSRTDPAATVVVLYGAPGCHLCEDARALVDAHLDARRSSGRAAPPVLVRDIHGDDGLLRAFMETIPVLEVGTARLELATSPARIRGFLDATLGAGPSPEPDVVSRDVAPGSAGADA